MKILLVTSAFAPVVSAHSERAVSLARLLRGAGHEVHVVQLDTEYLNIAPNYDPKQFSDSHFVARTGIHRHLKARTVFKPIRLLLDLVTLAPGPFIHEARKMCSQLATGAIVTDCDLIWVTTPPQELQLVGCWLSERFDVPYVMDLRDPWGESTRLRWLSPWHKRLAQRAYHRCLKQAGGVIANTPQHFELIRRTHGGIVDGKLHLIPNGYFEADFAALASAVDVCASTSTLTYAGNLYGGLVEESLVALHDAARSRGVPLRVRIVGAASGNHPFEYAGVLPPAQVVREIAAATWLFLYMPTSASSGPVMSLKAYQYARSGKPILYYGPKNETYAYLEKRSSVIHFDDPNRALDNLLMTKVPPGSDHTDSALLADSWESRLPLIERVLAASV